MLAKNILILSLVHIVRLVLPLLIIPVLTRRIGDNDFGIYMYAIAFAAWLSIFVEYGFNISSTREIACTSNQEETCRVIQGTQSAKLILALLTLPLLAGAVLFVPVFQGHAYWALAAWLLGVLSALSPVYYFQGRESLRLVAIAEALTGLLTLLLVYFLILGKADFYRLPIIMVTARGVGLLILTSRMYASAGMSQVRLFDFGAGIPLLKSGFNLFVFQGAISFYTSFNVVFLGFMCSPAQVGAYAAAERLMRAGLGFIAQGSSAIFPRLNALRGQQEAKMRRLRFQVLIGFIALGFAGMAATWVIAPFIVKYMFPGNFVAVENIVVTLALVIPAIAISNVLGFQYLLVERREKLFNAIIASAAGVNIVMAYFLVKRYEVQGMAVSWVVIEWGIAGALAVAVFVLRKNRNSLITG